MKHGRHSLGAIFDGEKFLIIGGQKNDWKPFEDEVCTLKGSTMTCVEQPLGTIALNYVYTNPQLFLVNFDRDTSKCSEFLSAP